MKLKDQKRYIENRKKGIKELQKLIYDKSLISKQIRAIQKELAGWDRLLIND